METITVKVIKCEKKSYWYSDQVGDEFEVAAEPVEGNYEVIKKPMPYMTNLIGVEDAEIVSEAK